MDNTYIEYTAIFIIILLFIYYSFFDKKDIPNDIPKDNEKLINPIPYITPDGIIKESSIKGGGRGVFSTRSYNVGDIIEVCPCIKQEIIYSIGNFTYYLFNYNKDYQLLAFGFCSIYNHKDDPNSKWSIVNKEQMKIEAVKPIKPGEEIFVSYGPQYFKDRGIKMK